MIRPLQEDNTFGRHTYYYTMVLELLNQWLEMYISVNGD
jgi:hypothetical protein